MPIPFFEPDDSAKTGLIAQSVDEKKGPELAINNATQVGGTLKWSAGVTVGKVVFEIAPTTGYTGLWEPIFSRDFVTDGQVADSSVSFTWPGPFAGFGRWRIADPIVGGTVTTSTQILV